MKRRGREKSVVNVGAMPARLRRFTGRLVRLSLIAGALAVLAAAPAQAAPFAYVTNDTGAGEVHQFDMGPGGGLTPLSPASVPAGSFSTDVAVSPDNASVYVANQATGDVSQYDVNPGGTLTPKSPATVLAGVTPVGVAVSPDGASVYVTNQSSGDVSQYDVGPGGVLTPKSPATVLAGPSPVLVTVSPDGANVYVTNGGDDTVSQYDVGPGGVLAPKTPPTVATGVSPVEVTVSPDGASAYVANAGSHTVSQYDVGPGGLLTPKTPPVVPTGFQPIGVVVSPDGASAYVTNAADGTVSQYDVGPGGLLTAKIPPAVTAGTTPQLLAMSADGANVYVANFNDGTVSQYDVGPGGALAPKSPATVAAGFSPIAVALTSAPPAPQCSDGIDNDGDTKIDFGTGPSNDPGCLSATDNTENTDANPQCSDELDNDGDTKIDFGTGPTNDPGCTSATDNSENTDANPQCSDELDNDGDTKIDFGTGPTNDPGCTSATDNSENTDSNPQCSDGLDNDGDGKIDFGTGPSNDPGCTSATDTSEADGPQTLSFQAQADARVEEDHKSTNYGTSQTLGADDDPEIESFLSFNVTGVSGTIQSAKLRVRTTSNGTNNGPAAYKTTNSWTETGIKWSNRPSRTSSATDDKGSLAANTVVEYNVKTLVSGNGTHSFILATSSSDGVEFHSREASNPAFRPELVLTVSSQPAPPPPVQSVTIFAEADARVEEGKSSSNFGSSSLLRTVAGGDPDVESFLRFNVTGVSGTIQSAKLRLTTTSNGTNNGPAAYKTTNSWTESGLKWSNKPSRTSGATDDKGSIGGNTAVEWEVKTLLTGNAIHSFILAQSASDGVDFNSREVSDSSKRPRLIITFSGS